MDGWFVDDVVALCEHVGWVSLSANNQLLVDPVGDLQNVAHSFLRGDSAEIEHVILRFEADVLIVFNGGYKDHLPIHRDRNNWEPPSCNSDLLFPPCRGDNASMHWIRIS